MGNACAPHRSSFIGTAAPLGKVVIYRNGVAYYERRAKITGGNLAVRVPRERVDDFLKSLTIIEVATGERLGVTIPRQQGAGGDNLTMELTVPNERDADVMMTYVTEAPAWKPSYRVKIEPGGKVGLEGWAVVDNTSGEDWRNVLVGVGASSALAFRYDLWSVRTIAREQLAGQERFAIAPPTGISPYGGDSVEVKQMLMLDKSELRNIPVPGRTFDAVLSGAAGSTTDSEQVQTTAFSGSSSVETKYYLDGARTTGLQFGDKAHGSIHGVVKDQIGDALAGVTVTAASSAISGPQTVISDTDGTYQIASLPPGSYDITFYYGNVTTKRTSIAVAAEATIAANQSIDTTSAGGETVVIHGAPRTIDGHYESAPVTTGDHKISDLVASLRGQTGRVVITAYATNASDRAGATARAEQVRSQLIDAGLAPARIEVVAKIDGKHGGGVQIGLAAAPAGGAIAAAPRADASGEPVGESHFMSERPMTIAAGSSAMVTMMHAETSGGVVYLYDAVSDHGNDHFAFRAVRLDNPTDDALEPGPVTVYGDDRFIGEGLTDAVPPRGVQVVPFALDRQVAVESSATFADRLAHIESVAHGQLTAAVEHVRTTKIHVTSRLTDATTVYVRHHLDDGWTMTNAPKGALRMGDSELFPIALAAGGSAELSLAESTPLNRTLAVDSDQAIEMLRTYAESSPSAAQSSALAIIFATYRDYTAQGERIEALRDQLGSFRERQDELHAQIVTLRAVKAGGDLLRSLSSKLLEISGKVQHATLDLINAQERQVVARTRLSAELAELDLSSATAAAE